MRNIPRLLFALANMIVLASCGSPPDVIVVDTAGAPVANAAVEPMSLSMNYRAVLTDAKGHADIGFSIQEVKWLQVRKTGYEPQNQIDFTSPKPIRVVLQPKL